MPLATRYPRTLRFRGKTSTTADIKVLLSAEDLARVIVTHGDLGELAPAPYLLTFHDGVTNDGLLPFVEARCASQAPTDLFRMNRYVLHPAIIAYAREAAAEVSRTVEDLAERRRWYAAMDARAAERGY